MLLSAAAVAIPATRHNAYPGPCLHFSLCPVLVVAGSTFDLSGAVDADVDVSSEVPSALPEMTATVTGAGSASPVETPGSKGGRMGSKLKKLGKFFSTKKIVSFVRGLVWFVLGGRSVGGAGREEGRERGRLAIWRSHNVCVVVPFESGAIG